MAVYKISTSSSVRLCCFPKGIGPNKERGKREEETPPGEHKLSERNGLLHSRSQAGPAPGQREPGRRPAGKAARRPGPAPAPPHPLHGAPSPSPVAPVPGLHPRVGAVPLSCPVTDTERCPRPALRQEAFPELRPPRPAWVAGPFSPLLQRLRTAHSACPPPARRAPGLRGAEAGAWLCAFRFSSATLRCGSVTPTRKPTAIKKVLPRKISTK